MVSGLPWGLALSSGVNTYLPLFLVAVLARYTEVIRLSPRFEFLASDAAILTLGILAASEILAEKVPVLDNLWDFVHTLLRPVAGAVAAGAVSGTDQTLGLILTMLFGGTLATAAHSAKASLRVVSTSKSFGVANPILSLGEDVAAVTGTLLSVYAPWVMLGIVLLFVLVFALIGPRLLRTLAFNLAIVFAWFKWLGCKVIRARPPYDLRESLLDLPPDRLSELSKQLEPAEELWGALTGWKRSGHGPRRSTLLVTPRRLVLVERRRLRKPRIESLPYTDLTLARHRNLVLLSRVQFLTRRNESLNFTLRRTHGGFGAAAVEKIRTAAGLGEAVVKSPPATDQKLASVPR